MLHPIFRKIRTEDKRSTETGYENENKIESYFSQYLVQDETAKNDFELARQNYHDLIVKGQDALDDMMEVARMSEHPRAFEVLSTMLKSIADINGDLLALHKKKKDYERPDPKSIEHNSTTNNLGSSTL